MDASRIIGFAAAGIVAAVVIGAVVTAESTAESTDVKVTDVADIKQAHPGESRVAWLDDGSKVYRTPVELKDGGTGYDETAEAPCKRRPVDALDCNHIYIDNDGRTVIEQAPELNRYPAASMAGPDCESVACAILLGEDAAAPEVRK